MEARGRRRSKIEVCRKPVEANTVPKKLSWNCLWTALRKPFLWKKRKRFYFCESWKLELLPGKPRLLPWKCPSLPYIHVRPALKLPLLPWKLFHLLPPNVECVLGVRDIYYILGVYMCVTLQGNMKREEERHISSPDSRPWGVLGFVSWFL